MKPTLPQHDPQGASRRAQLDEVRRGLRYAWDRPAGVAMAAEVPRGLGYPAGVMAQAAQAEAALAANRAALRLAGQAGAGPVTRSWCDGVYRAIPAPSVAQAQGDEQADLSFAWQRVAGANPLLLARVAAPPGHFPVSEGAFAAAAPGDSLAAAGAEGRLFLADWRPLDGLPAGDRKHLCAPLALFVAGAGGGPLRPVAIQCGQTPGPRTPVFTPRDGASWRLARLAVQAADANLHESFYHLGRAHFLLEAFALATERQLSPRHPLHVLLSPHLEGTLAINGAARERLLVPGGDLEKLLAPTLDGSLDLVRQALASFRLDEALLPRDLARRGVDDIHTLAAYPYRDDGLLLWGVIGRFVGDYVGIAYASDGEVAADGELRAWLDELRGGEGGRLKGLPGRIEGAGALAELLTFVVYSASAFHAALNYAQYDFEGYAMAMPMATYAVAPAGPEGDAEAAWAKALPDREGALAQLDFTFRQSQVRHNRLGRYPRDHFADPRVAEPLARFQKSLDAADEQIAARERGRFLPYPYLMPSRLTASIHI